MTGIEIDRSTVAPSAADWECGSCGALIDPEVGEPGDLYHLPDEDCRSVREIEADDGKVLIAGVLYDAETGWEADEDGPPPDLNREGDPTLNGAFG